MPLEEKMEKGETSFINTLALACYADQWTKTFLSKEANSNLSPHLIITKIM